MNMQILDAHRDASGAYRVDVSRGERVGRVSSEWFSRPADQRYLSLSELARTVRDRTDRSRTRAVESALIHVEARTDPERLALMLPGSDKPVAPTHWSFGQLASQVGAPAAYLRQLPAALAGINLQYGLTTSRAEQIKTLEPTMAALSFVPPPAQTMAGSLIMNSLRLCNASPVMAPVIHAGRCPGCSTGQPESTILASTSPRTRPPSMHRTEMFSFSWSMT